MTLYRYGQPLRRTPLTRSPLKRGAGLAARRTGIPRQSAKRKRLSVERRAFVQEFLGEHRLCQVCRRRGSRDVHESLRRSAGGAIVPGPKADAQGQTFIAVCRGCHEMLTNPTAEERDRALAAGWIQSRFNAPAGDP